jgi:sterol desaturase/sphingolipid hydroxylase (fatty acid hydroxylase superfamily)
VHRLLVQFENVSPFFITWGSFVGCGLMTCVFYVKAARSSWTWTDAAKKILPINVFKDRSFHMDLTIYLVAKLTDSILLLPALAAYVFGISMIVKLLHNFDPGHHSAKLTAVWGLFCALTAFIVSDFADYLTHYMAHKVPSVWELHKVHHSALKLNPLTIRREHPLPILFEGLVRSLFTSVPIGIFAFAFGIAAAQFATIALIASKIITSVTLDSLRHSHHPVGFGLFDNVVISPHMHQIHHSKHKQHWDKNFGRNLALFDLAFGTLYRPRKGEVPHYGISGYSDAEVQTYNTLQGAFIQPVIKAGCLIAGRSLPGRLHEVQQL